MSGKIDVNSCEDRKSSKRGKEENEEPMEESVDFSIFKEEFSWDRCPADMNLARKHAIANRIGKVTVDINKISRRQICECCFFPIINQEFSLCCNREDLAYLGPGITLYLEMVYHCFFILLALCLSSALPTVILNEVNYREENVERDFVRRLSMLSAQAKDNIDYRCYTNFLTVVVIVSILRIVEGVQTRTLRKCDDRSLSPSDFTIMIMGLAPNEYTPDELEEVIMKKVNKNFPMKNFLHVEKIVMAHDIRLKVKQYQKFNRKMDSIKKHTVLHHGKDQKGPLGIGAKFLKHNKSEINEKESDALKIPGNPELKIGSFDKRTYNNMNSLECQGSPVHKRSPRRSPSESQILGTEQPQSSSQSGVVFVIMNRQEGVETFERKYQLGTVWWLFCRVLFYFKIKILRHSVTLKNNLLNIKRAPEPSDIIWENLGVPISQYIARRIKGYLITFFMLCFSFFLIITCTYLEVMYEHASVDNTILYRMPIKSVKSLVIFVGNETIDYILERVAMLYEKHKSLTSLKASFCTKIVKVQYLNTIFLIPLSRVFISKNKELSKDELVLDLWVLFLVLAFLKPLFNLIDPRFLKKKIKQFLVLRSISKKPLTQKEANWLFQGQPVNMPRNYGQLLLILFFTFFYSAIVPVMGFLAATSLLLLYGSTKFEILRRNSRPVYLGPHMNIVIMKYLDFIPLQFILAEIFFTEVLLQDHFSFTRNYLNFICLGLALVLKVFPWKVLTKKRQNKTTRRKSIKNMAETEYSQVCLEFENDYDRANPITKKNAIDRWVRDLDKKRATMLGFGKKKDCIEKLEKLRNYGQMLSSICQSQEDSLKLYARDGIKKKLSQNTTEALCKYNFKNAIVMSKTIKEQDLEILEMPNEDQSMTIKESLKEINLAITERVRALNFNNYPKFIESLESMKASYLHLSKHV